MKYLVTGGAGFIGSNLAKRLLMDGHQVTVVDRMSDYYSLSIKEGNLRTLAQFGHFEFIGEDVRLCSLEGFDSVDGVFHLAAQPGVRASWGDGFRQYVQDNIEGTQRIFEFAASAAIPLVYASSSSVYGNAESYPTYESNDRRPVSPYGITKVTCEYLADAYASERGPAAAGMRYFTVYGPGQRPDMAYTRIARALLTDGVFEVYGSGTQTRDVTYVDDVVDATIRAMNVVSAGRALTYNVGGGNETSLLDAISMFESLAKKKLRIAFRPTVAGDVARTVSQTTRITNDTGWLPAVSAANGIARQWMWASQHMEFP